jgi:hypothetical protein
MPLVPLSQEHLAPIAEVAEDPAVCASRASFVKGDRRSDTMLYSRPPGGGSAEDARSTCARRLTSPAAAA